MASDCIFCKIINGEIPSYQVYEDKSFVSFLDIKPLTKGNVLVVPKKHSRWVYDVSNFGEYFELAKVMGLAAKRAFGAEWISFLTLGLEVPHAHIRVIPRYKKDLHGPVVDINIHENYSEKELKGIAESIRRNINKV